MFWVESRLNGRLLMCKDSLTRVLDDIVVSFAVEGEMDVGDGCCSGPTDAPLVQVAVEGEMEVGDSRSSGLPDAPHVQVPSTGDGRVGLVSSSPTRVLLEGVPSTGDGRSSVVFDG